VIAPVLLAVDWWARGVGIAGVLVALAALGIRGYELRRSGVGKVRVTGSAGLVTFQPALGQMVVERGKRFGYDNVVIDVVNTGQRPVHVNAVGFAHPDGQRFSILLGQPGQLPKKLEPGASTMIWSKSLAEGLGDLQRWLSADLRVRPYCTDAEGKMHIGKVDHHLTELQRQLVKLSASKRSPG
jgi:hypothetical protein